MTRGSLSALKGRRTGGVWLLLIALIGLVILFGAPFATMPVAHLRPAIEISGARITPTLGMSNAIGAFMEINNTGSTPDWLLGVESKAAKFIEVHESIVKDGQSRMIRVQTPVSVGARQTVSLKNGGLHLMIFNPLTPVNIGDKIPLTLVFEHAGRIDIVATAEIPQLAEHAFARSRFSGETH
ncbi:MAG: copper chaperone PCu(A)C [Hyphomonadaceae bacterium]|nr:copper chaperone PCu(A)C [Hyphomonadaceae bacterium]